MRSLSLSSVTSSNRKKNNNGNNNNSGTNNENKKTTTDYRRHSEPSGSHVSVAVSNTAAQPGVMNPPSTNADKSQRLYKTELCRNWEELDHCRLISTFLMCLRTLYCCCLLYNKITV